MTLREAFKAWKEANKDEWENARKQIKWALIGCAVIMIATLGFCTALIGDARASTVTVDCPGGAMTWNAATSTLTCPPGGGGGTPIPPDPPTTKCKAGDIIITGTWNEYGIETRAHGNFGTSNVLAVQLKPPLTWQSSGAASSWVEYIQGGGTRMFTVSRVPCSFDDADALRKLDGSVYRGYSAPGFTVRYKSGAPTSSYVGLEPGQTYWINAKNQDQQGITTCPGNGCNMRGSVRD